MKKLDIDQTYVEARNNEDKAVLTLSGRKLSRSHGNRLRNPLFSSSNHEFQFQFQFQFICFAILHIRHIMQNKMRQGDTKNAVLINMCLPMINNKLL